MKLRQSSLMGRAVGLGWQGQVALVLIQIVDIRFIIVDYFAVMVFLTKLTGWYGHRRKHGRQVCSSNESLYVLHTPGNFFSPLLDII